MAVTERRTAAGRRYYRAEVFVHGVRVADRQCETKSEAHAWHDETKKRWLQGRGAKGELRLAQVIERFRAEHVSPLRASTRHRWEMFLKFFEEAPLARVQMADVTSAEVDEFVGWLLRHPAAENPNRDSFVKELRALAVVFQFYVDYEDERFVIPVTKRHLKRARFKPADPERIRSREKFIPPEDLNRWLERLKDERDPVYYRLALVQVVMGMRIGEVAALGWDRVDFEAGTIKVDRTMDWQAREPADAPKTESSRRVLPMPPIVAETLKSARRSAPMSTMVFRNRAGALVAYEAIRVAYNRAFEDAGLKWTATHVLRHTHGTLGLREGRAEAVQANLGHSSRDQTETYAKAHLAVVNDIPTRVAAFVRTGDGGDHAENHARRGSDRKKVIRRQ
jgi:integrase